MLNNTWHPTQYFSVGVLDPFTFTLNAKEPRSRDIARGNKPITSAIHTPGSDYDTFNTIEENFENDPSAFPDGYGMRTRVPQINYYT